MIDMKYIKEYLCDKRRPSDEEIRECLEIVNKERGIKLWIGVIGNIIVCLLIIILGT